MTTLTLDIETTLDHSVIFCAITKKDNEECVLHTDPSTLQPAIDEVERVVGHNIIGFDAPVLAKVWDVHISKGQLVDTYVMSSLWNPAIQGGHSLASWGDRLGFEKIDFEDYDGGLTDEMIEYCKRDVDLTYKLFVSLKQRLILDQFSLQSIALEHDVAYICKEMERNGFLFDTDKANSLWSKLTHRMRDLEKEMQDIFPPIVERRYSDKTGKRLKDKVTVFNLGSRKQIGERLASIGVKFSKFTPTGQPIVDEATLSKVDKPEAQKIAEFLMLQKRTAQIDSWMSAVQDDGRVHGRVRTNGAVTGRMTHSKPNMAQVPAVGKLYGAECRELWTVPEGYKLVGIDASSLELRLMAHHMGDKDYIQEVLHGDIHTTNQKAAGLDERRVAKTFFYAFIYGAGDAKIGSVIGGNSRDGADLRKRFLESLPALRDLQKTVQSAARTGRLELLDGRKVEVRSEHAALNTLLQGDGAVIMKQALVMLYGRLVASKIPFKFVANVHDEWQIETPEEYAETVGKLGVQSIVDAGASFNLLCPMDGEYKIGNNWKETH